MAIICHEPPGSNDPLVPAQVLEADEELMTMAEVLARGLRGGDGCPPFSGGRAALLRAESHQQQGSMEGAPQSGTGVLELRVHPGVSVAFDPYLQEQTRVLLGVVVPVLSHMQQVEVKDALRPWYGLQYKHFTWLREGPAPPRRLPNQGQSQLQVWSRVIVSAGPQVQAQLGHC